MKKSLTVVVALAIGLLATVSAFAQTLVCEERVSVNTAGQLVNWYESTNSFVFRVAGEKRLVSTPRVKNEPGETYPIAYYFLSAAGGPTSDSFAGRAEFAFPPQAAGVEIQVHYQIADNDWTAGETASSSSGQVAACPLLVVPQGGTKSFVVRVKVADWVPSGTRIDADLKGITGLTGVTLGKMPELDIITYTGPFKMTWLKQHSIKVELISINRWGVIGNLNAIVTGDWHLEATTDLKHWVNVVLPFQPTVSKWEKITLIRVPVYTTKHHEFFRVVAD